MVKPVPPERKAFEESSGNGGVMADGKNGDSVEILEKQLSPVASTKTEEALDSERRLRRHARKAKSKIPNSMQKVRQVMEGLRQDKDKQNQLEQIQRDIESDLQKSDRTDTNPWHKIFSVTKHKASKKPGKTWMDSIHH